MRRMTVNTTIKIVSVAICCSILTVSTAAESTCNKSFSEVFREVSPSVVQIFSVSIDPFSLMHRVQHSVGTGFVIDDNGHVVTNAHLVHGTSEVMISIGEDDFLSAEIVGVDPISDLAILKLTLTDGLDLNGESGIEEEEYTRIFLNASLDIVLGEIDR